MARMPVRPWDVVHFGERLGSSKFGYKMTRRMYAYPSRSPHQRPSRELMSPEAWESSGWAYQDEDHTKLSDVFLLTQRDAALVNFDLSMKYFASLDAEGFEAALQHALAHGGGFKPVQSLPDWDDLEGVYVMVFDEYRQFYVGQSRDVRKRIKGHWSTRKSFDRLLFGSPYSSILAVDELRALDTTRIYARATTSAYELERRTEAASDRRFCLNRMMGGEADAITMMAALAGPRSRHHGGVIPSMSWEDYRSERDRIAEMVERSQVAGQLRSIAELASLDMGVFSVSREDGSLFTWSRRDAIRGAARRGELSVDAYTQFLEAIGETVVWPSPRVRRAEAD